MAPKHFLLPSYIMNIIIVDFKIVIKTPGFTEFESKNSDSVDL